MCQKSHELELHDVNTIQIRNSKPKQNLAVTRALGRDDRNARNTAPAPCSHNHCRSEPQHQAKLLVPSLRLPPRPSLLSLLLLLLLSRTSYRYLLVVSRGLLGSETVLDLLSVARGTSLLSPCELLCAVDGRTVRSLLSSLSWSLSLLLRVEYFEECEVDDRRLLRGRRSTHEILSSGITVSASSARVRESAPELPRVAEM